MMKKRKVQKGSDDKDNKKKEGFGNDLEQARYKRLPIKIPRIINILFQIDELARERGN